MCDCKEDYCCKCAIGPQGPQGTAGLQGVQGLQGVPGEQGIPGKDGMQGIQGIQGVAGVCLCDGEQPSDRGCDSYCNIFALPPQTINAFSQAGDSVVFQGKNAVTATDFDLSMMSINGEVKFLKAGVYYINWGAEARVRPPIDDPTPSFSFGLWLNGVVVPGSVLSGYTQAPNDDTLHISGEVTIQVKENDILLLKNAAALTVDMNPNTVGIQFPVTVASLNIHCVKKV